MGHGLCEWCCICDFILFLLGLRSEELVHVWHIHISILICRACILLVEHLPQPLNQNDQFLLFVCLESDCYFSYTNKVFGVFYFDF